MMKKLNYFTSALLLGIVLLGAGCSKKNADANLEGGVLINGVIWAKCNVGAPGTFAANPEDVGMFYQWNRRVGWSATGNPPSSSPSGMTWNSTGDTGSSWIAENDPCPPGWRVPTLAQFELLVADAVTKTFDIKNGVKGLFLKQGSNEIFLPIVNWRLTNGNLSSSDAQSLYWSNTKHSNNSPYYLNLVWNTNYYSANAIGNSAFGNSVRCVKK